MTGSRLQGWSRKAAAQASGSARSAQHKANRYFSLSGPEENLREYLKEKPIIDLLEQQGVEYKQRISEKEIIVSAGAPKIVSESAHAAENRAVKTDRADMTAERAQSFVDSAEADPVSAGTPDLEIHGGGWLRSPEL